MKNTRMIGVFIWIASACCAQYPTPTPRGYPGPTRMSPVTIDNQVYIQVTNSYVYALSRSQPEKLFNLLDNQRVAISDLSPRILDSIQAEPSGVSVKAGTHVVLHFAGQVCLTGFTGKGTMYGRGSIEGNILHIYDCSWINGNQRSSCR